MRVLTRTSALTFVFAVLSLFPSSLNHGLLKRSYGGLSYPNLPASANLWAYLSRKGRGDDDNVVQL